MRNDVGKVCESDGSDSFMLIPKHYRDINLHSNTRELKNKFCTRDRPPKPCFSGLVPLDHL